MKLLRLCLVGSFLLSLQGCGKSSIEITGKLTKNGGPLPSGQPMITLSFAPEETTKHGTMDTKQTYPTILNRETGEFSVELPPGKYKVNVLMFDSRSSPPKILPSNPPFTKQVFDLTSAQSLQLDLG